MTAVTWNYTTVPQSRLDGRILTYPRGRVLGGSSSISKFLLIVFILEGYSFLIDFLVYTRGSNEGYDQWANLTGDDSWAWSNLEPFYLKVLFTL